MTIAYGEYLLTGTVDEVLEFIRKTTPTFASGSLSGQLDERTAEAYRKLFELGDKEHGR